MNLRSFPLMLSALCLFCVAQPAFAAGDGFAPTPRDLANAQQRLGARLEAVEVGAVPPLLSNPDDATLLRAAFDPRGLRPVSAAALIDGMATCDIANRYNVALSFVGGRKDEFKGVATAQATKTLADRSAVNMVRYQDEMSLSMRFMAACMAGLVQPAAEFWNALPESDKTPVRLGGIRKVRQGMTNIYIGLIMVQVDPSSRPANRTLLLEALLTNNARLAQAMMPADRKQVLDVIAKALPAATGQTKADLIRLRDELASLPCLQLCALG